MESTAVTVLGAASRRAGTTATNLVEVSREREQGGQVVAVFASVTATSVEPKVTGVLKLLRKVTAKKRKNDRKELN